MGKRINLGERKQKRTEINSTRNDITNAKLLSQPNTSAYDTNYERIFGENRAKPKDTTWVWRPDNVEGDKQG